MTTDNLANAGVRDIFQDARPVMASPIGARARPGARRLHEFISLTKPGVIKPRTPHNIVLGGMRHTRKQVLLYTIGLVAVSVLPCATHMSGAAYLACALVLGAIFIALAASLWRRYSDRLARATFRYSIAYLALLFATLLVDHYL